MLKSKWLEAASEETKAELRASIKKVENGA